MKFWYILGKKVGRLMFMYKNYKVPFLLISPHDMEDLYYEIIDYMNSNGLDGQKLIDVEFDEFENIIIGQINKNNRKEKKEIFLLGVYAEELKILVSDELNFVGNISSAEILEYLTDIIHSLKLKKSLSNISITEYHEEDFERIDTAVRNGFNFDEIDNSTAKLPKENKKFDNAIKILIALIAATATIIAAII